MPARVSDTGVGDSIAGFGTSAAPGAGATLVAITAPPVGVYTVTAHSMQSGTVDAVTNNRNLRLRKGSTVIADLRSLATDSEMVVPRVSLDGATNINVLAIGAAGVGSVYHCDVVVTQVE